MSHSCSQRLHFRVATPSDNAFVLELRNSPDAVRWSRAKRQVRSFEHLEWFQKSLSSPEVLIVICECVDLEDVVSVASIGVVRFGREPSEDWAVSIYVAEMFRGKGLGTALLQGAINYFETRINANYNALAADVHSDNVASRRIFEKLGFKTVSVAGDFHRLVRGKSFN